MTRPLPELITKTRHAWQITPPTHQPHQPTADPKKRRAAADTTHTDQIAHATRVRALVAARYNTRRPTRLADIITQHVPPQRRLDLLNAAQEIRNRHLALIARPDLPQPRYYLPEQLAGHHATTNTPTMADEIAALIHHPNDANTYLDHLRRLNHPELADTAETLIYELNAMLTQLTDQLRHNPRQLAKHDAKNTRTTLGEHYAIWIAKLINRYNWDKLPDARNADDRNNKERDKQRRALTRQQRRQEKTGHLIPGSGELSGWYPVIPNKPHREIAHLGRLGRRRIATNTGRNPNRIHNYYTDPHRKIFTRKTRGTNALVVVDCSGSMQLTETDLDHILRASSGATVIAYSANDFTTPNTHLIAHNSRRVRELPTFSGGNGNDAPALLYAITHYRKHKAPVIWITDGGVTGLGDTTHDDLRQQCRRLCTKYGVTLAHNTATALADLDLLAKGQRPPQRLSILNR